MTDRLPSFGNSGKTPWGAHAFRGVLCILCICALAGAAALFVRRTAAFPGRRASASQPYRTFSGTAMGTLFALSVVEADAGRAEAAWNAARAALEEIERELSVYNPSSAVARVNRSAAGAATALPPHFAAVFRAARRMHRDSGGAFDPTVEPLMEVWGFRAGKGAQARTSAPSPDEIGAALERVGLDRHFAAEDRDGALVLVKRSDAAQLDFGGIAKGYAVDCVCDRLVAAGHADFLVNLGGNIRCFGTPSGRADSEGWIVGIRDPRRADAAPLSSVRMGGGQATATSGGYERFVEYDGVRHCHILDPRTGRPVPRPPLQVTVFARTALEADALSTALFIMGESASAELLARYPGSSASFVVR